MGLVFAYFVFIALVLFILAAVGKGVGLPLLGIAVGAMVIACLIVIIKRLEQILDELRYRNDKMDASEHSENKNGDKDV